MKTKKQKAEKGPKSKVQSPKLENKPLPTPTLRVLDLSALVPSHTNQRKEFNPTELAELVESIKAKGVVQPPLVRASGRKGEFEIIAGHRRWKAAKIAKVSQVRCLVYENLSDLDTLDLQLLENLQRVNLNAMEEATGFQQMLDLKDEQGKPRYTVDTLAAKVNKSRSAIYETLRLLKVAEPVKKAMADAAKMPASTAKLIATLPDEKSQLQALKEITDGELSFRDAEQCVESIRKEIKDKEEMDKKIAAAEAKGETVLSEAESKKVYRYGYLYGSADYVEASRCASPYDKKTRSWNQLVGKEVLPVWCRNGSGLVKLFRKTDADTALAKSGIKFEKPKEKNRPKTNEELEQDFHQRIGELVQGPATEAVLNAAEEMEEKAVHIVSISAQLENLYAGDVVELCKSLGFVEPEDEKEAEEADEVEWLRQQLPKMTQATLRRVLIGLALPNRAYDHWEKSFNKDFAKLAEQCGVDLFPLEKAARNQANKEQSLATDAKGAKDGKAVAK